MHIGKLLGATAKLQANKLPQEQRALYQKKLLRWVNLVLDKYSEDTRAFRRGGQQMPCVADAMDVFAKVYDHVAGSATMASEMLKEWMPQLETRKGKAAAKLGAGGGGGGGGGGAPAPGGVAAAQEKEKKKRKKKKKKAPAARQLSRTTSRKTTTRRSQPRKARRSRCTALEGQAEDGRSHLQGGDRVVPVPCIFSFEGPKLGLSDCDRSVSE